jgi:hypothetical protein
MPPMELWVTQLPQVFEATFVYANLHACMMAGTHWGLAGSLHSHDDEIDEEAMTKRHMVMAAMIPAVLWSSFAATMFIDPSPGRFLVTLGVTCFGYLAISIGDKMLVDRNRAP